MQAGSGSPKTCQDLAGSWWQILEKNSYTGSRPSSGARMTLKHQSVEPVSNAA